MFRYPKSRESELHSGFKLGWLIGRIEGYMFVHICNLVSIPFIKKKNLFEKFLSFLYLFERKKPIQWKSSKGYLVRIYISWRKQNETPGVESPSTPD